MKFYFRITNIKKIVPASRILLVMLFTFSSLITPTSAYAISCGKIWSTLLGKPKYDRKYEEIYSTNFRTEWTSFDLATKEKVFNATPAYSFETTNAIRFTPYKNGIVRIFYGDQKTALANSISNKQLLHIFVALKSTEGRVPKHTQITELTPYFSKGLPTIVLAQLFSYKIQKGRFGELNAFTGIITNLTTGLQILFDTMRNDSLNATDHFDFKKHHLTKERYLKTQTHRYILPFLDLTGHQIKEVFFHSIGHEKIEVKLNELTKTYGIPKENIPEVYQNRHDTIEIKIPNFSVYYDLAPLTQ